MEHVKWAMEVVGAGFALPIEETEIIWKSIEIYKRWLLIGSEGGGGREVWSVSGAITHMEGYFVL
jgi:hypothetical protein